MAVNGHVTHADAWKVGIPGDSDTDFEEIDFPTGCSEYGDYVKAAHALYYAFDDRVLWKKYRVTANILMQLRFDGNFGFPGGIIDLTDKSPVDAVNREIQEEMNIGGTNEGSKEVTGYQIRQSDHVVTYVNHKKRLVTHFYAKEITKEEFSNMEKQALDARDWGSETLGIVRVPLYVMTGDNNRGLPVFLANQYAGNARQQLLLTLRRRAIVPAAELERMVECYKNYIAPKDAK